MRDRKTLRKVSDSQSDSNACSNTNTIFFHILKCTKSKGENLIGDFVVSLRVSLPVSDNSTWQYCMRYAAAGLAGASRQRFRGGVIGGLSGFMIINYRGFSFVFVRLFSRASLSPILSTVKLGGQFCPPVFDWPPRLQICKKQIKSGLLYTLLGTVENAIKNCAFALDCIYFNIICTEQLSSLWLRFIDSRLIKFSSRKARSIFATAS